MIIIDDMAEGKLSGTLERIRAEAENARCLYFNLKDARPAQPLSRDKLLSVAAQHITSPDAQIYLCTDGDIFILAPVLFSKEAKALMLDMGGHLKRPVTDEWALFLELPLQISTLILAVDAKIEARRKALEDAEKKREMLLAEKKRQAILNGGGTASAADISSRRSTRQQAELMMIEDDVFSSRLVENVLQKKFSFKTLATADEALDTYARLAPDMLFLDINLPDVTGHELLQKIVAIDPDAYVVMLSGNADKDNIVQAMDKGAKGFIAKPFTREKLFQYIERCPTIRHS